jgi:dTDP-4-amino-4,6-dideoxygalactose transaminase
LYEASRWDASVAEPALREKSGAPLWRFPLLAAPTDSAHESISQLRAFDRGVSTLYGAPVTKWFTRTEYVADSGNGFRHARDFAARLFTLPCHHGVSIRRAATLVNKCGGESSFS